MVSRRFSIVIPVYNVARYLRECLDSVLAQTYDSWEVICVDDGSTDGSEAILDEYAARFNSSTVQPFNHSTFRVIHQKNAGVSAARNAAIDVATGEYLLFVDGDDACVPWMLEDLVRVIELNPDVDIVKFNAQNCVRLGQDLPVRAKIEESTSTLVIDSPARARIAYEKINGVLLAWGGAYRRVTFEEIRFRPYPNGEDALYAFECMCSARRIAFFDAQLYRYRLPRAGSANGMTLRNLKSCCDIGREYERVSKTWRYAKDVRSIARRKGRVALYGIKYRIVLNVPLAERKAAWGIFQDHLRHYIERASGWRWDVLMARAAVCPGGRFVFHVLGYYPFLIRVYLVRTRIGKWLRNVVRR